MTFNARFDEEETGLLIMGLGGYLKVEHQIKWFLLFLSKLSVRMQIKRLRKQRE
jgi:hypothetical protein